MAVKQSLQSFCRILGELGCASISPEDFRQAKFGAPHATLAMLRALHDVVVLRLASFESLPASLLERAWQSRLGDDSALEFVQLYLSQWGFTSAALLVADIPTSPSPALSRTLLLALAWLLADSDVVGAYAQRLLRELHRPPLATIVNAVLARPLPQSSSSTAQTAAETMVGAIPRSGGGDMALLESFRFADMRHLDSFASPAHQRAAFEHAEVTRRSMQAFVERLRQPSSRSSSNGNGHDGSGGGGGSGGTYANAALQMLGRLRGTLRTLEARQMQRAQLATQLHRLQLSAPFPPSLLRAPVDFTGTASAPKPKIAVRHTVASEARAAADRFAKLSLSAPTTLATASSQQSDAAIHDQPCTLSLCEIMLLRRPAELQSQLQILNEWLSAHQFFDTIAADEAVFWHWLESIAEQQRKDTAEQVARDHALAAYADSLSAAANATSVTFAAASSSTGASATASVAASAAAPASASASPPAAQSPTVISTAQLRAEVESLLRARVSQQPALMAAWRHLVSASSTSATTSSSAPVSADELSALAASQTDELDAFAADFSAGAVAVRSAARHSVAALSGATVVGGAPLVASSSSIISHSNRQPRQQQVDLLGSLASHVGSLTLPRAQLSDLCRRQHSHRSSSAASSPASLIERLVTELADRADAAAAAQTGAAAAALRDVRLPPHVRLRRE